MQTILYLSLQGEDKIHAYQMEPGTGQLALQPEIDIPGGPAPMALSPTKTHLYVGLRAAKQIACFRVEQSGDLALLGAASLDSDPCYLSTDRHGRFLFASYYGAGKITIHAVQPDGTLAPDVLQEISTAERAHCIQTDPSNQFVLVPHTAGPNLIFQFLFDQETGQVTPNGVPQVIPEDGVGPRHYCFHPSLPLLYFSNEQGSSVTMYELDTSKGTLSPQQTLATLPKGYDGKNSCAQIHLTPSGEFLYVSNRGHDSLAIFRTDPDTGLLTAVGHRPTEPTPRAFNIDPEGRYLFAAGLGSGKLAAYRIEPRTGLLDLIGTYSVGRSPMWVQIEQL